MAISMTKAASHRAYQILHVAFVIAPLIAGIDKFTGILCVWEKYLWPGIGKIIAPHTFMMAVGVIEIIAAIIVLVKPKIGAWIVAGWLLGIIVNLLLTGQYFDVALRDLGLLLAAVSLGFLSVDFDRPGLSVPSGQTVRSPS